MEYNNDDSNFTTRLSKVLDVFSLFYIFIVTILCMIGAYISGGIVFSGFIGSVGALIMLLFTPFHFFE